MHYALCIMHCKRIAFTTSFPVEIIFAAGHTPIDLNNIFIANNPDTYVRYAENKGFPRNICAWIKGMYAVIQQTPIDTIIGITEGDCSNTHSLMSILADEGKDVLSFSYSWDKDRDYLDSQIQKLERAFSVTRKQTMQAKRQLDAIREKLILLDQLTYQTNQVTATENHTWLVTSSDFDSDYCNYSQRLDVFLAEAKLRSPLDNQIRLGYIGVPPIISDIYTFIEECGARVVFNEVQRQFSMFYLEKDIVDQYLRFTYPYAIFDRINDIKQAITERNLQGIIAYTQSFCHRQLDIISLRKHLNIPILLLEADKPGNLDNRTKLRIESFIEMIGDKV